MATGDYNLAATARAIGEPARAAMLLRMMDGRRHTARELADVAGVVPSTASAHLGRLVRAGLVTAVTEGRTRLHALASPEVAAVLEALAAVSPLLPVESLRDARTASRLRAARLCYSHLGGRLAVVLTRTLVDGGVVGELGEGASSTVHSFDHPLLQALDITDLPPGSAPAARGCLDWTERTPHLAGRLGTAIAARLLDHGWLRRRPLDRALTITPTALAHLDRLGLDSAPN
ncbi:ArsR/SmtB family transcription factor [Amycolatopsis sp. NPDC051903]|uniref:ArsR/SmtB family transcription factor n=1 Tax=Amycolatopsis sp. NPDC051903 TaxID=3363936 RepID=UPI00379DC677